MTDTITLSRAEAQQILDALYDDDDGMEASKLLRAALAQQAEPVIVKAITEVEPNENQTPIAWINWNAATGERSVSFEQESELASQPLYYTPVTGYDLDEITDLKEERERQRDHAVGEIQKLITRNAELESHMQGLSNEINDFQNTIERLTRKVAERSAEHLAAEEEIAMIQNMRAMDSKRELDMARKNAALMVALREIQGTTNWAYGAIADTLGGG